MEAYLESMRKPVAEQPTHPGADDSEESTPVTPEVERIIRERIAEPEGPTRPWSEVKVDLDARRPLRR